MKGPEGVGDSLKTDLPLEVDNELPVEKA